MEKKSIHNRYKDNIFDCLFANIAKLLSPIKKQL